MRGCLNAGEHSCRERSAEAENAQPPGSCCAPGSWNGAIDCRERSTEAENALPPFLVGGSERSCRNSWLSRTLDGDRERSTPFSCQKLVVLEEAEQARDRRHSGSRKKLAGERSQILFSDRPFYTAKIVCSWFPGAARLCSWSGTAEPAFGTLRSFSRAVLMSKNILGAPRRNVLRAGRSSDPRLGTMLDIDLGCIVTTF